MSGRLGRLAETRTRYGCHEVRLTVDWISKQPLLLSILTEAELAEPDIDVDRFDETLRNASGGFEWPTGTESGRASLIWKLMQRFADLSRQGHPGDCLAAWYGCRLTWDMNMDLGWIALVQDVMRPLFEYLGERIGAEASVLHVLERYVRRVEWFDRDELYGRFSADTPNGEEIYNDDLQRFLYLDGNYVTHAKARSASGEPDLVGGAGDDLLVCEGKIFGGSGRGVSYLAKGVRQVVEYAHDYNQSVAYLVVFNIEKRLLQFPTDGTSGSWPPYVELSGVRVHLVGVRALPPDTTASKLGKANPVRITREKLISPDDGD